ncbi:hypothetical protein Avbf_15138 [Armadillidium vulgare]|nr:hypothetical protein Avbf_15138 [Armadillidium vulgare]
MMIFVGLYKCYEGNKNYHLITLKYLPAECKSVENILEKEQSVYSDARFPKSSEYTTITKCLLSKNPSL